MRSWCACVRACVRVTQHMCGMCVRLGRFSRLVVLVLVLAFVLGIVLRDRVMHSWGGLDRASVQRPTAMIISRRTRDWHWHWHLHWRITNRCGLLKNKWRYCLEYMMTYWADNNLKCNAMFFIFVLLFRNGPSQLNFTHRATQTRSEHARQWIIWTNIVIQQHTG